MYCPPTKHNCALDTRVLNPRYMAPPTIIFLNGTSSAGKTSIAHALQKIMDEPYLYFASDAFRPMLPPYREELGWDVDAVWDTLRYGFYKCIAAMYETGNSLVADHSITRPHLLRACAVTLAPCRAYFVGVYCPFEVAEQRERERESATIGLAKEHFDRVHQHGIYDLTVDTSQLTPEESARQIADFVASQKPTAFGQLCSAPHTNLRTTP